MELELRTDLKNRAIIQINYSSHLNWVLTRILRNEHVEVCLNMTFWGRFILLVAINYLLDGAVVGLEMIMGVLYK